MNTAEIYYDPDGDSQFDVPAGQYLVRFEGCFDKGPFKEGPNAGEPRWGCRFKVLEGPHAGKTIEQDINTKPRDRKP
jgi:hypothetical protein